MFSRTATTGGGLEEDAAVFGLDANTTEKLSIRKAASNCFEIHDDLADVFFLFQNCQGSWRVSPAGGLIGLDKTDVIAVAKALNIGIDRKAFELLQVCEAAYISEFNKRMPKR